MKKIKDFLYDKNDILIALLILVAAAFIIVWRMDAIMAYPQTIFEDGQLSDSQSEEGGEAQDGNSQEDGTQDGTQIDSEQSGPAGEEQNDDGQNASGTLWADGTLTRDVEISVTGSSAAAAVNCLVDAGLFDDYAEYQTICEDTGLDHEKVSAGTFIFAKGSTKKDIARKINWS